MGSFGPVCQLWSFTLKCMHDSKLQHKALKVTRNTTNRDKHINEASKQAFANSSYVYGVFGAQRSRDCTVTVLVSQIKRGHVTAL